MKTLFYFGTCTLFFLALSVHKSMGQWTEDTSTGALNYNGGDVGIGIAPNNKFHVYDGSSLDVNFEAGSGAVRLNLIGDVQQWSLRKFSNNKFGINDDTYIKSPFVIEPNGNTNSLYIKSSGNIGIATSTPAYKLSVVGDIWLKHAAPTIFQVADNSSSNRFLRKITTYDHEATGHKWFERINVNDDWVFGKGDPNEEWMVYDFDANEISFTNVNVGIGTTTPEMTLDVKGAVYSNSGQSVGNNFIINRPDVSGYGSFLVRTGGVDAWSIGMRANETFLGLYDEANDVHRMVLTNDGNVGIGTTSPSETLEVAGKVLLQNELIVDGIGTSRNLRLYNTGNGSEPWSGALSFNLNQSNDLDLDSDFGSRLFFKKDGGLVFQQASPGSGVRTLSSVFFIESGGKVGIGTSDPDDDALLTVAGSIHSQEVKVLVAAGTGPDYVFAPEYELRSLEETQEYISEHSHLPEVPSAAEMEANGMNVGDMNLLLLKKIEELTLHMIDQNKKIESLTQTVNTQQKQIENLTK